MREVGRPLPLILHCTLLGTRNSLHQASCLSGKFASIFRYNTTCVYKSMGGVSWVNKNPWTDATSDNDLITLSYQSLRIDQGLRTEEGMVEMPPQVSNN